MPISPPNSLHRQVRDSLRKTILEEYGDGQKFPSEPELIKSLGVSQGTVRRALGDLAAEGLLVRKVPAGTFVRKPATHRPLGLIIPRWDSDSVSRWVEVATLACQAGNIPLKVHHTAQGNRLEALLEELSRETVDGHLLISNAPEDTAFLVRALARRGSPCFTFDQAHPGACHFAIDAARATAPLVEHLLALGHRRITYVVNEPRHFTGVEARRGAFADLTQARGLAACRIFDCEIQPWQSSHEVVLQSMDRILEGEPTALLFASDFGAWAALRALGERGWGVPQDISVAGYNDDGPSRYLSPSLTSMALPFESIAARFLELARPGAEVPPRITFTPELIPRLSTGPAARTTEITP